MAINNRTCMFDGCGRYSVALGYCGGHYQQQRQGKQLSPLRTEMTLSERIDKHTDRTGECWLWTAAKDNAGYGLVRIDNKTSTSQRAHRVTYELAHGSIPDRMLLDHTCHNRSCVRPDHLRPTSNKQNAENRAGAQPGSKSGVRGVSWHAASRKWVARVTHNRESIYLGMYATIEQAGTAARLKRLELFTHNDLDRAS